MDYLLLVIELFIMARRLAPDLSARVQRLGYRYRHWSDPQSGSPRGASRHPTPSQPPRSLTDRGERTSMKALILAAGRGRRLWPFTTDRPKCLLSIGPTSILEQQLLNLERILVRDVVLVCGFGADLVGRVLDAYRGPLRIKLLYNPFFALSDNLISLWVARAEMDGDFVLLNGDNVFHPDILVHLLATTGPCHLMVDRKPSYDDDDMKLQLQGCRVRRIGKDLPLETVDAESLGIMIFRGAGSGWMRQALEEAVGGGEAVQRCYVDGIQALIDRGYPVSCCEAQGLPWTDVDTLEDLSAVRHRQPLYQVAPGSPPSLHYQEAGEQV